jgi:hypothetical protein
MLDDAYTEVELPPLVNGTTIPTVGQWGGMGEETLNPRLKDIKIPHVCCCCGIELGNEFGNIPINIKYYTGGSIAYQSRQILTSRTFIKRTVDFLLCEACDKHRSFSLNGEKIINIASIIAVGSILGIIFSPIFFIILLVIIIILIFYLYIGNKKFLNMTKTDCTASNDPVRISEQQNIYFSNKSVAELFADLNNGKIVGTKSASKAK